jgi:hypothetical protein
MNVIAEAIFDLAYTSDKMCLRVFMPEKSEEKRAWSCTFEIDVPLSISRTIYGESSLQALILAIKVAASCLYGSDIYKNRQLGVFGVFGGDLSIPAPSSFLGVAPYRF